jgi:hypothetical protein
VTASCLARSNQPHYGTPAAKGNVPPADIASRHGEPKPNTQRHWLHRIYGYSRIGDTPLFNGYGLPNDQILANWRREMLRMGLIATALLAIAGTTIFRQNRSLGATALS